MFLIERLISLSTYAIALAGTAGIMSLMKGRQYKLVLYGYLLLLCLFAFFYQPYITADLFRLREYIEYWIHKPWGELFSYALRNSAPAWVLFSYVTSKFGNINWLQTVACLWTYSNIFYIISHEIDSGNLTGNRRGLMLFFIMGIGSIYLQAISGIRTMLGFSIISRCIYMETVENKGIALHMILYLFAALLHSTSMVLVIARFAFLIIQSEDAYKKIVFSVLVLLLGAFSLYFLRDFVGQAIEKGQNYLTNRDEYSYSWEILIGLLEAVEILYVCRKFHLFYTGVGGMNGYHFIALFCTIWTIISLIALPFSYGVFRRYMIFSSMMCLPLLGQVTSFCQNTREGYNSVRWIWLLASIIFILSILRGDICGYKFIVLS